MKYKLAAIDLDGTLLNSRGEISEENKQALKKIKQLGMEIVLTSGRMSSSINSLAEEIGSENYYISGNGTIIHDIRNEKIIYNNSLSKEKTLSIIKTCENNSIYFSVNTEQSIIAKNFNYNTLVYNYENSKREENKITKINIVEDIYDYINKINDSPITKITICDENEIVFKRIIKIIKEIPEINVLDVSHMSKKVIKSGTENIAVKYFYTEITSKNVNKWTAINYLINKLGVKREEVVAIGDNVNDIEMIENSGLGIVIGNSALSQKNIGDVIVKSCDESGVADAINKYIL